MNKKYRKNPGAGSHILMRMMQCAAFLTITACSMSGSQEVGYQARIDVAKQMLLSGQYNRGYRLLEAVEKEHGDQTGAYLALGDAYLEASAFLKANLAFEKAKRKGALVKGDIGLGRVALARNEPKLASDRFLAALTHEPQNVVAINGIGVSHDLFGNHHLARLEYARVLEIDPTHSNSINNLGLSLALQGSGERSVQILSDLARSELDDATIRQNLAIGFAVVGRRQDAMRLARADLSEVEAKRLFKAVVNYRRSRR